jgi:hypothetical protein
MAEGVAAGVVAVRGWIAEVAEVAGVAATVGQVVGAEDAGVGVDDVVTFGSGGFGSGGLGGAVDGVAAAGTASGRRPRHSGSRVQPQ